MAKAARAPLSLASIASPKPGGSPPAVVQPAAERAGPGRPKSLPDGFQTVTVRVTPAVRRALRQAALNHERPIQQIITDGIMDQLARLGVVVQD